MAALFSGTAFPQESAPAYRVICHPSNPTTTIERRLLRDLFLKRVTVWPSGEVIRPVDLGPNVPLRALFTREILKRPVEAIKNYWQQRIFAGHELPPPEVTTEEEVTRYVLKHPGAIGYVSAGTPVHGAKVLEVY